MTRRRTSRGATLIEVMTALSVLLVAMLGFAATLNVAARSTALGHRRTTTTFLRGGLIDRIMVTPRGALASLPTAWTDSTAATTSTDSSSRATPPPTQAPTAAPTHAPRREPSPSTGAGSCPPRIPATSTGR